MTAATQVRVKTYIRNGRRVRSFRRRVTEAALSVRSALTAKVAIRRGKDFEVMESALKDSTDFDLQGTQGSIRQFKTDELLKTFNKKDDYNRELKYLSRLEDTGVVPKVIAKSGKNKAILFEKVKGDPAHIAIEKNIGSPKRMGLLGRNIKEAIGSVHKKGVVHNDLHTENLLIDKNLNVKIIDFGMASPLKRNKKDQAYQKLKDLEVVTKAVTSFTDKRKGNNSRYADPAFVAFMRGIGNKTELNNIAYYKENPSTEWG